MKRLSVAIDGPAGAGKSTVARQVAENLGLTYVDTGAMYRAVTWKALQKQADLHNEEEITRIAREADIRLTPGQNGMDVWVDGKKVTEDIRTPEVTSNVSAVAGMPGVRQALVEKQRQMAVAGGVVMDGRDIGTHVLPDAEVKVFLTASIEERAQRRFKEMKRKGYSVDLDQLREEIRRRDEMDSNREHSPLRAASDAVHVDTTNRSLEEVIQTILNLCRTKVGEAE
ncbi:cytidylate kinase [Marinithermofilum abyssi]|uniref:Cytidylate kinase n=1 Tax=Marinithermofilum abyssi TaxID=1571185 RepID=A0A8J2VBR9_9BACL|nr:(d)CMP kinase [Marinithermofilum abyssi]GGE11175.1 cytidylate kinase [Marinithermofilum abyssi]